MGEAAQVIRVLVGLGVISSAIWIAVDVSTSGRVDKNGLAAMGPVGWFFSTILLPVVAIPLFLAKRGEGRRYSGKEAFDPWDERSHADDRSRLTPHDLELGPAPSPAEQSPIRVKGQPVAPPPGWYDDPDRTGKSRWWDGTGWTEHRKPASSLD